MVSFCLFSYFRPSIVCFMCARMPLCRAVTTGHAHRPCLILLRAAIAVRLSRAARAAPGMFPPNFHPPSSASVPNHHVAALSLEMNAATNNIGMPPSNMNNMSPMASLPRTPMVSPRSHTDPPLLALVLVDTRLCCSDHRVNYNVIKRNKS